MERIAVDCRALNRAVRYAASFRMAPTANKAANGTPKRQVVNRSLSFRHTAHMQRWTANTAHSVKTTDPTAPVSTEAVIAKAAIRPDNSTASRSSRRCRPRQCVALGVGALAYKAHMVESHVMLASQTPGRIRSAALLWIQAYDDAPRIVREAR